MEEPARPQRDLAASAMVLGGVVGLEGGAAIARSLFTVAGVPGTVSLRLGFGALVLSLRRRPTIRMGRRSAALLGCVAALLAVHHLAFYAAVDRLPLGVAVTLEFCGPLAVALAGSRRPSHVGWAVLAAAGVVLASGVGFAGHWSGLGVALALTAGACWAGYIALFPRAARSHDAAGALSSVTLVAALVTVPYGLIVDGQGMLTARGLALGLVIALLADVISYSLQAQALRRLSGRVFSLLSSTEPAVGALFGLLTLHQHIRGLQWAGIAAVTVAAAAASLERERTPEARATPFVP